jgi:NADPH:quinone reductase-like Zn-dependent oxidoreductase/acyl carrier protein
VAAAAREAAGQALGVVQAWLSGEGGDGSRLVLVTHGAVAAAPGEDVADLVHAPVWGLVRSAQAEHPGRFVLVDTDGRAESAGVLAAAVASGEPQVAIRAGTVTAARLARAGGAGLVPPPGGAWRLDIAERGTLDRLELAGCPEVLAPLGPGQVRVRVAAAGLNFRDVLNALGMYPGNAGLLGSEAAGTVTEVAADVTGVVPGDKVAGLFAGAFGPVAVTDQRLLVPVPEGWSFADAAAVPVAFATAYYALVVLAGLRAGESVLIHAAAGGVGMAAVQVARYLGAEVFGTASAGKHGALRALGLDEAHIGDSRSLAFGERFAAVTGGRGVDVVLNALSGAFVDESAGLLARGGRFIEMGKTDIRDPGQMTARYPETTYQAFDLGEAGPELTGQMLRTVMGLIGQGALGVLPVRAFDVRRAADAFRFVSQARHTGKVVLTIPAALDPDGTVLITGAPGALGGLVAGHLVTTSGAGRLLLVSRSGPAAAGAAALAAALAADGAGVTVTACDVACRPALAAVLARIPAGSPLTAVIHAAGAIDDGVVGSLTAERVAAVMRPKADAAALLDELTGDAGLAAFVLFSSAAGVLGGAGQGGYAAANAFLDALAARRRARGLPATSLAWGLWARRSALTGHLTGRDIARVNRGGMTELSDQDGLALLDRALTMDEPLLVPAAIDIAARRAEAARDPNTPVPALLRALIRQPARRRAATDAGGPVATLAARLGPLPAAERLRMLTELVAAHAAAVLGHATADAISPDRALRDTGFDSLTAVELRNRLAAATGLRLPATLAFDHPTPGDIAEFVDGLLARSTPPEGAAPANSADPKATLAELDKIEASLSRGILDEPTVDVLTERLRSLLDTLARREGTAAHGAVPGETPTGSIPANGSAGRDIDSMDVDALVGMALGAPDHTAPNGRKP